MGARPSSGGTSTTRRRCSERATKGGTRGSPRGCGEHVHLGDARPRTGGAEPRVLHERLVLHVGECASLVGPAAGFSGGASPSERRPLERVVGPPVVARSQVVAQASSVMDVPAVAGSHEVEKAPGDVRPGIDPIVPDAE